LPNETNLDHRGDWKHRDRSNKESHNPWDKNQIIAGVRNILKAKQLFSDFKNLDYRDFDFENPQTFDKSLDNIDCIFLLRPPHISDVDKYFKPLIQKIFETGFYLPETKLLHAKPDHDSIKGHSGKKTDYSTGRKSKIQLD